jgi:hypothetical protein
VWDASDLSPVEGVLVMAHKNLSDTAFTHDVPVRLAKTDTEGYFAIRNLSPGKYKVYAIEEGNRNYKFDQPGELIAWNDSVVSPSMEYVQIPDTLAEDSVVMLEELVYSPNDIQLFLFKEDEIRQYFKGEERKSANKLSFVFGLPVKDFQVEPIGIEGVGDWAIFEPSFGNDTVYVWITDSLVYNRDTLAVALSYMGTDSLNESVLMHDTLTMYYFEEAPKKESRRKRKAEAEEVRNLKFSSVSSSVDVNSSFSFIVPTPVKKMEKQNIHLFEKVDTVMNELEFTLLQDSVFNRKFYVQRGIPEGNIFL